MPQWLIYGKRTGKIENGEPVYDKTFKALNYSGVRVTKLVDAGTYATREDAQDVIDKKCTDYKEAGLCKYEIRKAK